MKFYLNDKLYLTLPEAKVKPKKTVWMRRCRRCSTVYKTKFRSSKICPECYLPSAYKQQHMIKTGQINSI